MIITKTYNTTVALIIILISSPLIANAYVPYLSVGSGISIFEESGFIETGDFRSGFIDWESALHFDAALGLDFENSYLIEIAASYLETDGGITTDANVAIGAEDIEAGLNYLYLGIDGKKEFRDFDKFTPFFCAGVGVVDVVLTDPATNSELNETSFSYNLGAGISYNFSDNLDFYVKYSYYYFRELKFNSPLPGSDDELHMDLGLQQFTFGLCWSF